MHVDWYSRYLLYYISHVEMRCYTFESGMKIIMKTYSCALVDFIINVHLMSLFIRF
jgi:hypothetical protein